MNRYAKYVQSLGFSGVEFTQHVRKGVAVQLEYENFNPQTVKAAIGRPTKHNSDNLFVFRVSKTQAIRVNTKLHRIWLGNGKKAVRRFMESV